MADTQRAWELLIAFTVWYVQKDRDVLSESSGIEILIMARLQTEKHQTIPIPRTLLPRLGSNGGTIRISPIPRRLVLSSLNVLECFNYFSFIFCGCLRIFPDHCLDFLRQGSMCHADYSMYTVYWGERRQDIPTHHVPKVQKCVNWDKLHKWMLDRAASTDMLVGP